MLYDGTSPNIILQTGEYGAENWGKVIITQGSIVNEAKSETNGVRITTTHNSNQYEINVINGPTSSNKFSMSHDDITLFGLNGATQARFDSNTTSGETRFLLWDTTSNTLKRVSIGATDSGGTGFKVLRVPN
jgi:hypothetical protein